MQHQSSNSKSLLKKWVAPALLTLSGCTFGVHREKPEEIFSKLPVPIEKSVSIPLLRFTDASLQELAVRNNTDIKKLSEMRDVIVRRWREFEKGNYPAPVFQPDYNNDLSEVVLHIGKCGTFSSKILSHQIQILRRLPVYSRIQIVLRSQYDKEDLFEELHPARNSQLFARVKFLNSEFKSFSPWARDVAVGDARVQFKPLFYNGGGVGGSVVDSGTHHVDLLEDDDTKVVHSHVYFMGGNQVPAINAKGEKILFCGADDYLVTRETYEKIGLCISEEEYLQILCRIRGADQAIIIGPRDGRGKPKKQPRNFFHLDQCKLPIKKNTVAVTKVIIPDSFPKNEYFYHCWENALKNFGEKWNKKALLPEDYPLDTSLNDKKVPGRPELDSYASYEEKRDGVTFDLEKRALEKIREKLYLQATIRYAKQYTDILATQLASLGFCVDRVETPVRNILAFVSYLNSFLYYDCSSGTKFIHVSVYPYDGTENFGSFDEYPLLNPGTFTTWDKKALKYFNERGFKVFAMRDGAHREWGNSHCLYR